MAYLAILFLYLLERVRGTWPSAALDGWFRALSGALMKGFKSGRLHAVLLVGLPGLALAYVQLRLNHILFGLPEFILYLVVLFYSLGRGNLEASIEQYLQYWQQGDIQAAWRQAMMISPSPSLEESDSLGQLHSHAVEAVLYRIYEQWFAVVFWFALLGPWGALLYRLMRLSIVEPGLVGADGKALLEKCVRALDWLPSRLLTLSFALAGNFGSCYKAWRRHLLGGSSIPVMLGSCGIAALGDAEELACQQPCKEVQRQQAIDQAYNQLRALLLLASRSAIVWLVSIAVLVLVFE